VTIELRCTPAISWGLRPDRA